MWLITRCDNTDSRLVSLQRVSLLFNKKDRKHWQQEGERSSWKFKVGRRREGECSKHQWPKRLITGKTKGSSSSGQGISKRAEEPEIERKISRPTILPSFLPSFRASYSLTEIPDVRKRELVAHNSSDMI